MCQSKSHIKGRKNEERALSLMSSLKSGNVLFSESDFFHLGPNIVHFGIISHTAALWIFSFHTLRRSICSASLNVNKHFLSLTHKNMFSLPFLLTPYLSPLDHWMQERRCVGVGSRRWNYCMFKSSGEDSVKCLRMRLKPMGHERVNIDLRGENKTGIFPHL